MDELTKELSLLSRLMDAAALRTRVIANNLANNNTPGFTRSEVVFEKVLGEALIRGDADKAAAVRPEVEVRPGGDVKPNGNNVHMEEEMADLMKTTILYNIVNRILDGKFDGIKTAIQGR
jgi:flagellar basal-body rod protein FlgB